MYKILLLIGLVAFTACEPEQKTWEVTYKVLRTSGGNAEISVTYTTANDATESIGNITDALWQHTETIVDGKTVNMDFNLRSGSGTFRIVIEVNGSIVEDQTVIDPISTVRLSTTVQSPTGI